MIMLNKHIPNRAKAAADDLGSAILGQADYADLMPTLDVADGLGRVMNNKKLYLRLLRSFSGPQMADDIVLAVEDGDHVKVQQAAHALKGVAANLGLFDLKNISLEIETLAKAEASAEVLLPALNLAVEETAAAIKRLLICEEEA